jgi:hypothetical protein
MSNSRVGNIPSNALFQALSDIGTDLDQLKERQRTSARSGVLGYSVVTDGDWDIDQTFGTNADTSSITKEVFIIYSGDGSQDVAFANVSYSVFANGNELTPSDSTWTDGTRSASIAYFPLTLNQHTYIASFNVTTLKAVEVQIKAYIAASQRGTLTFQVL